MSTGQAVLLFGGTLLILAMMVAAMIGLDINTRRRIQRRPEAWQAEGGIRTCPRDGDYGGTGFYSAGGFLGG
jgi:hypothetical protein